MEKRSVFSFRKGDFFAVVLVVLIALAVLFAYLPGQNAAQDSTVQVLRNNTLIKGLFQSFLIRRQKIRQTTFLKDIRQLTSRLLLIKYRNIVICSMMRAQQTIRGEKSLEMNSRRIR